MKRRADVLSPDAVLSLRRALLRWYRREKRALPWRRTRDPYAVWISEAMLQQTRVETVLGYYRRFLARFPTVRSLARARIEDVLAAWSGMGYYRRARFLHRTARAVVERHGGHFPRKREALLELPGIGAYTAGAVASIAFDEPEALVDGNVARVLGRLFALDAEPGSPALRERLWSLARSLVPGRGAGEWNQALMELGALVCTPRDPDCERCPAADRCVALRQGRVDELPRRRKERPATPVEVEIYAVRERGRWLLERRPERGRMAGLWQLPTIEIPADRTRRRERTRLGLLFPVAKPRALRDDGTLLEVRHTITNHRIRAVVKRGIFSTARPAPPLAWVEGRRLGELPLTGMTRKCLTAILAARPRTHGAASPRSEPSKRNRHDA